MPPKKTTKAPTKAKKPEAKRLTKTAAAEIKAAKPKEEIPTQVEERYWEAVVPS